MFVALTVFPLDADLRVTRKSIATVRYLHIPFYRKCAPGPSVDLTCASALWTAPARAGSSAMFSDWGSSPLRSRCSRGQADRAARGPQQAWLPQHLAWASARYILSENVNLSLTHHCCSVLSYIMFLCSTDCFSVLGGNDSWCEFI